MDLNCEHIAAVVTETVLTLGIRRPEKKNALTGAMYKAMTKALQQAQAREDIRVVVLQSEADCFTAGNDLADFHDRAPQENPAKGPALSFIGELAALDKPIVAAVNGLAVGVGTTMLLHCDFVYAGRSAQLRTPFIDLGLCPEAASSLLLPLIAGPRRANRMLLLGETLTAEEAQACGLVTGIVADAELHGYARAQALKLAAKPPRALADSKRLLKRVWAEQVRRTIALEGELFGQLLRMPEAQAIIASFLNRHPA